MVSVVVVGVGDLLGLDAGDEFVDAGQAVHGVVGIGQGRYGDDARRGLGDGLGLSVAGSIVGVGGDFSRGFGQG